MKKILVVLVLMFTVMISNAQSDNIKIYKIVDDMSDTYFLTPERKCVTSNDKQTIGFVMEAHITNEWEFKMILGTLIGIGSCNENDELILLFENNEKINMSSWKKFNCKGIAYFNLDTKKYDLLKTQKIVKLKITNGRTYDSFTHEIDVENQDYFIKIIKQIELKQFTILK